ncbi:molybdopterin converting factor subunit 1 [Neptuniibacter marinus]|uniref:molybdopterin converting factor subunit 1 n=1 Tax=Neptuniibacter marinus TaxID=1806670 RepID=UPI000829B73F|nr:molybdopterin converting factor subunit 1 [Neptuniibacter marinus]
MIKILYFASLRERLGIEQELLELPAEATVAGVIDRLVDRHGDQWKKILKEGQVLTAVNLEMCNLLQPVSDNDEVAFFPPVTGG